MPKIIPIKARGLKKGKNNRGNRKTWAYNKISEKTNGSFSVLNLVLLTTVNKISKPRVIKIEKKGRSVRLKTMIQINPMIFNFNKMREKENETKAG